MEEVFVEHGGKVVDVDTAVFAGFVVEGWEYSAVVVGGDGWRRSPVEDEED